jgi:hypothetical protein
MSIHGCTREENIHDGRKAVARCCAALLGDALQQVSAEAFSWPADECHKCGPESKTLAYVGARVSVRPAEGSPGISQVVE